MLDDSTAMLRIQLEMNIKIQEVVDIAEEAGRAILEIYNSDDFGVEAKGDASPLTKADTASNAVICAGLARIAPHIPVISEENKAIPYSVRRHFQYCWVVDPLDGTKEFIKRNGQFTVMIGLVHAGRPILGVVHTPTEGRTHYAAKGHGAFVREAGKPETALSVKARSFKRSDEGLTLLASASHLDPTTEAFVGLFKGAKMLNLGSSLKFNVIAEGKGDIYARFAPTSEWDTCAADIIVEEAGGKVIIADRSLQASKTWLEDMVAGGKPLEYNKENILNPEFLVVGAFDLEGSVKEAVAKAEAEKGTGAGASECNVM